MLKVPKQVVTKHLNFPPWVSNKAFCVVQLIAPPIPNNYFSSTNVPLIANQLQIITAIQTVNANINLTRSSNTSTLQNPKSLS